MCFLARPSVLGRSLTEYRHGRFSILPRSSAFIAKLANHKVSTSVPPFESDWPGMDKRTRQSGLDHLALGSMDSPLLWLSPNKPQLHVLPWRGDMSGHSNLNMYTPSSSDSADTVALLLTLMTGLTPIESKSAKLLTIIPYSYTLPTGR